MKLTLNEAEIREIIRDHVLNTVTLKNNNELSIDFTATRGAEGIVATIDIPYMGVTALPDVAAPQAQAQNVAAAKQARQAATPKVVAKEATLFVAAEATASGDAPVVPAESVAPDGNGEQEAEDSPLPAADAPKTLFGN